MRGSSEGPRLKVEGRQVGSLDPGGGGDQRAVSPTERLHPIAEVLFCPVGVALDEWCGIFIFHVEVSGDGEVIRRPQFVQRRFHALVVMVLGFVVRVGVCDEVASPARCEGRPKDSRV